MQLFYAPDIEKNLFLPIEEAKHCFNVLRKKSGDIINLVDGKGNWFKCEIINDNLKKNQIKIIEKTDQSLTRKYIHLIVSPTKNMDRNEWMVEKAIEIGVSEITFILTANSERRILKLDRILKKAISAMKQSLKSTLPKINELLPFDKFISEIGSELPIKFIAHLDDKANKLSDFDLKLDSYILLIGAEGGFTESEVEKAEKANYKTVSLGNSRLRTETAAIYSLSLLNQ